MKGKTTKSKRKTGAPKAPVAARAKAEAPKKRKVAKPAVEPSPAKSAPKPKKAKKPSKKAATVDAAKPAPKRAPARAGVSPKIKPAAKLAKKIGAAAPLAQVGAIVANTRLGDKRILMVTSRETHRWIIPKGWPMKGRKPWDAAAVEVRQEAGIVGSVGKRALGSYTYFKRREAEFDFCEVQVFVLEAKRRLVTWREKGERDSRWMSPEEAADAVDEPGLSDLIRRWGA